MGQRINFKKGEEKCVLKTGCIHIGFLAYVIHQRIDYVNSTHRKHPLIFPVHLGFWFLNSKSFLIEFSITVNTWYPWINVFSLKKKLANSNWLPKHSTSNLFIVDSITNCYFTVTWNINYSLQTNHINCQLDELSVYLSLSAGPVG